MLNGRKLLYFASEQQHPVRVLLVRPAGQDSHQTPAAEGAVTTGAVPRAVRSHAEAACHPLPTPVPGG